MILQKLTILLLTLSMNISAKTNDFNVEKKSHKNVDYEEVGMQIFETFTKIGQATYTDNNNNEQHSLEKYVMTESNANCIYTKNPYLIIANTTYTIKSDLNRNENTYKGEYYGIYNITNVYNSEITINLETMMQTPSNQTNIADHQICLSDESSAELINLTLNSSTTSILYNWKQTYTTIEERDQTQTAGYIDQELTELTLNANQTKTIIFYGVQYNNATPYIQIYPNEIQITGSVDIPITPYEVVDIPNLIFTILSMPFTFISQAFNLTIFPNTPYQVNFSNLFMTIIAIFVLIWLIKHIFGK